MSSLGTFLYTKLFGTLMGEDEFGNRYYESRHVTAHGRKKRWVVYKGLAEPSKVPPYLHGWLHYTREQFPDRAEEHQYKWQKEPLPNLTGTTLAYLPPGHVKKGAHRAPTTADYEAWKP
jgi:NADH:ubiquinone oxidoreductase subunit